MVTFRIYTWIHDTIELVSENKVYAARRLLQNVSWFIPQKDVVESS